MEILFNVHSISDTVTVIKDHRYFLSLECQQTGEERTGSLTPFVPLILLMEDRGETRGLKGDIDLMIQEAGD